LLIVAFEVQVFGRQRDRGHDHDQEQVTRHSLAGRRPEDLFFC
jgi:hypothetical protein